MAAMAASSAAGRSRVLPSHPILSDTDLLSSRACKAMRMASSTAADIVAAVATCRSTMTDLRFWSLSRGA